MNSESIEMRERVCTLVLRSLLLYIGGSRFPAVDRH